MRKRATNRDGNHSNELSRKKSAALAVASFLGVVILVITLAVTIVRQQWDRQLERTESWFEENVGSLDLDSYRNASIAEEANLWFATREISREPFVREDWVSLRVDLGSWPFESSRGEVDYELQARAIEQLEQDLAEQGQLEQRLDALVRLKDSVAPPPTQSEPAQFDSDQQWQLGLLSLSRLRSAGVALELEKGDCSAATNKSVSIERMASIARSDNQLVSALVGLAIEKQWLELTQRTAEAAVGGKCATTPDWPLFKRAAEHLEEASHPYATLMASEGALAKQWDYGELESPFYIRWLGNNAFNARASVLALYGGLAQEQSAASDDEMPAAPETAMPAKWLEFDVVADMLVPNLRDIRRKFSLNADARSLTRYAVALAICSQERGCEPEQISLPRSSSGVLAHCESRGDRTLVTMLDGVDNVARVGSVGSLELSLPQRIVVAGSR